MEKILTKDYQFFLRSLKEKIRQARSKSVFILNNQMLTVYWEIGYAINEQETMQGWGAKVVERLAKDLHIEFPDMKGISPRSLRYMRDFANAYPDFLILQPPAAKSHKKDPKKEKEILQHDAAKLGGQPIQQHIVGLISWSHHQIILNKVKSSEERLFYIQKAVENGWGREILSVQIDGKLFERQGRSITNFKGTMPGPMSELAQETLKNPYLLEFLEINEEMRERELERALIKHIQKFILELGRGFAYVGNQYNLTVAGDEFFADLLFYNYHLHCFVIFELKVGEFKPEYAGKLNFYVNTVNEKIKGKEDKPSIGVLLCKTPNETVIRYSLKGIKNPIGVSDYKLERALPKQLKNEMPTIKELEQELETEIDNLKTPAEKRFVTLKQKLALLNKGEAKTATFELLENIYKKSIKPLFETLLHCIKDFNAEFQSTDYFWFSGNKTIKTPDELEIFWKEEQNLRQNKEINFQLRLSGLIKAGVDAFDIVIQLTFSMDVYWYGFKLINYENQQFFLRKMYDEQLSKEDISEICEKVYSQIVDRIEIQLDMIADVNRGRRF